MCVPHYKEDTSRKFKDFMGHMGKLVKEMERTGQ
jgi:hypothetical protein